MPIGLVHKEHFLWMPTPLISTTPIPSTYRILLPAVSTRLGVSHIESEISLDLLGVI